MKDIESARVTLRRFDASDLRNLIELESDPEVMKFTGPGRALSEAQIEERLQKLLSEEMGSLGVWAAQLKTNRDFVGWFMLRKTKLDCPELGFMLVKRHWGSGLATEAARALVDYGLVEQKLSKIAAVTSPQNLSSIRVLEKAGLGFKKTVSIYSPRLEKDLELLYYDTSIQS